MSVESKKILDKAIKDPGKVYKTPEKILKDPLLSQEEKDKILHSWEQDQIALMRAEEENMCMKTPEEQPTDLLCKIKEAENKLNPSTHKKGDRP